jgi:hypothetical protein
MPKKASRSIRKVQWSPRISSVRATEQGRTRSRVAGSETRQQLKFVLNKNADADVTTTLAFEAMNEVITASTNWRPDAEPGIGLKAFAEKNQVWNRRRELALNFWAK